VINKENLVKLAKYIFENTPDGSFDMNTYEVFIGGFLKKCPLGILRDVFKPCLNSMSRYDHIVQFLGKPKHSLAWAFLFSSRWASFDNTKEGFIKRVVFLLKNGEEYFSEYSGTRFSFSEKMIGIYEKVNVNDIYGIKT